MWNTLQNNCISNGIGIRGSKSQVCFHIEDFIPNHTLLCMQVCKNGSHFLQGTYIFNYALTTKVSAPVTRHVEPLTLLGMQCERQRILFKQDQGSVLLNASGLFFFYKTNKKKLSSSILNSQGKMPQFGKKKPHKKMSSEMQKNYHKPQQHFSNIKKCITDEGGYFGCGISDISPLHELPYI